MRYLRTSLGASALLALAACAGGGAGEGAYELKQVTLEQVSENRFAVSIEAVNADGYEVARCVGAAYVNEVKDKKGKRTFDFYVRDGGKITDEFRRIDGVRVQTTKGLQTYSFAKTGTHDGRDTMNVDLQLADCDSQGLPTKLGEG